MSENPDTHDWEDRRRLTRRDKARVRFADACPGREVDGDDPRDQPRAAERSESSAADQRAPHRCLQNKPAQIRILGEIADVLLHVGGVDLHGLAGAVGRGERDLVEHALHHGLQPPRADILHA